MRSVYLTALRLYTSEFRPPRPALLPVVLPAAGDEIKGYLSGAGVVQPIAHAFWASEDRTLPGYVRDGLLSAVPHFRRVFLWQYETITNMPNGVLGRPAAYLLPLHVARTLRGEPATGGGNVPVELVSDVVRFRAAAFYGGVVIDGDCLWLKSPPNEFWVSTLFPKRTSGVGHRSEAHINFAKQSREAWAATARNAATGVRAHDLGRLGVGGHALLCGAPDGVR